MIDKIWDFFVNSCITIFMPLVCVYFSFSGSLFFNVACEEARGLERLGNQMMIPTHYLFMGRTAARNGNGEWEFSPRFDYSENFGVRTAASAMALLPSFVVGTALKTAALLQNEGRSHYREMLAALQSTEVRSNVPYYRSLGLDLRPVEELEWFTPQGHQRRPGDEQNLTAEKEALKEIAAILTKADIPWFLDCGTCLGAYRYGGVIPWDEDADIAVFQRDFDNVWHALNQLDRRKYMVQDWSSREHPKSYIKVYVRKSKRLIDIYNFAIDPEKKETAYIFSLEHAFFFPDWWKLREQRCKAPAPYAMLFPLKRALFDGIEVFVPNDIEGFLRRYYGENLAPAKIYNEATGQYEKDLSHPYWKTPHVH